MDNKHILYSLNAEDAQIVARETIYRSLTDDELRKVEERLGDYFPNWSDLLEMVINDVVKKPT